MIASCSNCKTKFKIKDEKIPDKGARVRCSKCKKFFIVKKSTKAVSKTKKTVVENATEPPPMPPTPMPPPPQPPPGPQQEAQPAPSPAKKGEKNAPEEDSTALPSEECKRGAPAWIMTFADLATLMLTFFVLLLSFANMDIVKFQEMLGSVQDAFGVTTKVKGDFQSTLQGEDTDKESLPKDKGKGGDKESAIAEARAKEELDRQEVGNKVEEAAKAIDQTENIAVSVETSGVRVRIKGSFFFGPGSAFLKKDSLQFLNSLSKIMKQFPFKLTVEGHTDSIPISTVQFPSNWELSAVRATTVLRHFIDEKGIDPSRLTAIGYAANKPLASNEESTGRAKNRRVEFIFSK